jgi:hypothetical protein
MQHKSIDAEMNSIPYSPFCSSQIIDNRLLFQFLLNSTVCVITEINKINFPALHK